MAGSADAPSEGSGRKGLSRRTLIKAAAAVGVGAVPVLWARGNGSDPQTAMPSPRPTTPSTSAAADASTGATTAPAVTTTAGIGGAANATTATTEFPPLPDGPVVRAVNFHPGSERSAIGMLAGLGVQAVRLNIEWQQFQPDAKGRWDDRLTPWLDEFLPRMAQQRVRVMAGMLFSPGWANGGQAKDSRNFSDEDFCGFVGDVHQRWGRYIEAYEIWNEPGYVGFLQGTLDEKAERYARLLRAVYPYIKQLDPTKTVLGGSLYQPVYDNQEFLARLYELGAGDSFDVLSQHMFGDSPSHAKGYGWAEAPVPYDAMFAAVADNTLETMQRYGDGDKPIWITETGVNTSTGGNGQNEDVQASQMADAYEQLRRREIPNIERLYWYHLTDDSRFDPTEPENRFGIMSLEGTNWRLKPAFEVLANLQ